MPSAFLYYKKTAFSLKNENAVFYCAETGNQSLISQFIIVEIAVRTRAAKVVTQNPPIDIPSTMNAVIFNINPLTTKVKRPRVSMLSGSVRTIMNGLMMASTSAKTMALRIIAAVVSK